MREDWRLGVSEGIRGGVMGEIEKWNSNQIIWKCIRTEQKSKRTTGWV